MRLRFFAIGAVCLFLWCLFPSRKAGFSHVVSDGSAFHTSIIPQRIWQTWDTSELDIRDEQRELSKSWLQMNPEYRHELLTDDQAPTYVEERYFHRPDIVAVFKQTRDRILQADLVRYLALLADGGIYTDIDTDCSRPIREWIPEPYVHQAGLVLGVEYDSRGEEIRGDFVIPVQLCQWTFMSKPGHPVLRHVVDRVFHKVSADIQGPANVTSHDLLYVLETTGPRIFTQAVLEAMSTQMGRPISYSDITNLTSPKLFGDVLIMPVSAFASGQEHSGSKPWGNDEQLMSHHFLGFQGWKANRPPY